MKLEYSNLVLEVVEFETYDVIETSPTKPSDEQIDDDI